MSDVSWFAADDRFATHPKVLKLRKNPAHDSAIALWTLAGTWCASQPAHSLTGFVPLDVIDGFGMAEPVAAAQALTDVGLWENSDGGWLFHDWSQWNGPEARKNRSREQTRARQQAKRLRDCEAGVHSQNCPTHDAGGEPWSCPRRAQKAAAADFKSARNAASRDAGTGRDGTGRDGSGSYASGPTEEKPETASATDVTSDIAAEFLPPKEEVQP